MMGHTSIRREWPAPSLEEMATEATRLGREIAEGIQRHCVGANVHEHATARRCVQRLREGEALDVRDEDGLELLAGILARELAREVLGKERAFRGMHHPEGEDIGDVVTLILYTPRGLRVAAVEDKLARLRWLRRGLLDRAAAERSLRRLMSG
jgi:hypothetical protein